MPDITPGFTKKRGSHSVEGLLDWLDKMDTLPIYTRIRLKKRVKEAADKSSATGQSVDLPLKRKNDIVMVLRFYGDGSVELGWPDTMAPVMTPPPEREI